MCDEIRKSYLQFSPQFYEKVKTTISLSNKNQDFLRGKDSEKGCIISKECMKFPLFFQCCVGKKKY